jgi:hypothetical protein
MCSWSDFTTKAIDMLRSKIVSQTTTRATGSFVSSGRIKQERHARANSFPLRSREGHGGFKANNKRCSKDLQAAVDGYCKFWVEYKLPQAEQDKKRGALIAIHLFFTSLLVGRAGVLRCTNLS